VVSHRSGWSWVFFFKAEDGIRDFHVTGVQTCALPIGMKDGAKGNEELIRETLRLVSPGTALYEGLENILRARTGALIVVGDSEEVLSLVNGGFRIDTEVNPAALYELAKRDGAPLLSR